MKFKDLIRSKKFWTLIAAIIAALSAYFLTGCASFHGVAQSVMSYQSGDTLTTVIRYEQTGNIKKK
uniref:Uncharacterized protein n=1 Tax=Dulem virus 212 TaxID=3145689 RepID=A0AAU8B605_9VIRU